MKRDPEESPADVALRIQLKMLSAELNGVTDRAIKELTRNEQKTYLDEVCKKVKEIASWVCTRIIPLLGEAAFRIKVRQRLKHYERKRKKDKKDAEKKTQVEQMECPECEGSGVGDDELCPACDGHGTVETDSPEAPEVEEEEENGDAQAEFEFYEMEQFRAVPRMIVFPDGSGKMAYKRFHHSRKEERAAGRIYARKKADQNWKNIQAADAADAFLDPLVKRYGDLPAGELIRKWREEQRKKERQE